MAEAAPDLIDGAAFQGKNGIRWSRAQRYLEAATSKFGHDLPVDVGVGAILDHHRHTVRVAADFYQSCHQRIGPAVLPCPEDRPVEAFTDCRSGERDGIRSEESSPDQLVSAPAAKPGGPNPVALERLHPPGALMPV